MYVCNVYMANSSINAAALSKGDVLIEVKKFESEEALVPIVALRLALIIGGQVLSSSLNWQISPQTAWTVAKKAICIHPGGVSVRHHEFRSRTLSCYNHYVHAGVWSWKR